MYVCVNFVKDYLVRQLLAPTLIHDKEGLMSTEKVTVGQRSVSSKTAGKRPSGALKSRRKFLYYFPGGFRDETYIDWERSYKWKAHQQWEETLNRNELRHLLKQKEYSEIAAR